MGKFMFLIFTLLISMVANAQYYRFPQNGKFPNQKVLEVQHVTPASASATLILNADQADTNGTGKVVTTFLAQPDVPRNLVVTPAGTTADIPTGNVVITGKDAYGQTISESFAFSANDTAAQTGSKAFKSVTSISFPAEDSPFGAKWSVGTGTKIGLNHCMDGAGWMIKGVSDGADITGMTVAASATAISGNTVIPNPAPNGSHVFDFLFVQNYQCK